MNRNGIGIVVVSCATAAFAAACGSSDASPAQNIGGSANEGGLPSYGYGGTESGTAATGTGGNTSTSTSKSIGGTSNTSTGGDTSTNGTGTGGASATTGGAAPFDWGTDTYDPSNASSVDHQNHNAGAPCFANCHTHDFTLGGTVYQANDAAASGVELGIIVGGTLYTTYSGTRGNFFLTVPGTVDWATAPIGMRSSNGSVLHPTMGGLSGNCNSCHGSSNRIVTP